MKKFILDLKTWRCGGDEDNQFGKGDTFLLNKKGNMCCLGQFSQQIDNKCKIYNKGEPSEAKYSISTDKNPLVEDNDSIYSDSFLKNSQLSIDCININDHKGINLQERIKGLSKRLKEDKIKLSLKNNKLFNKANQLVGKHLIINQPKDLLRDFVNDAISVKEFEERNSYNRQLVRHYGSDKARKIVKKLLVEKNNG